MNVLARLREYIWGKPKQPENLVRCFYCGSLVPKEDACELLMYAGFKPQIPIYVCPECHEGQPRRVDVDNPYHNRDADSAIWKELVTDKENERRRKYRDGK